jgi:hypothetical protein
VIIYLNQTLGAFGISLSIGLFFSGSLAAAVYGLPEPPTPAPTPQFWLSFSDDFLGMAVLNTDDYRTANVSMGGKFGENNAAWRFGFDYSMLTNRGDDGSTTSRSDEITASLGYAIIDSERDPELITSLLTLGVGGQLFGNFGGETIQNEMHRTFGYSTVHFPYDANTGIAAFSFYHGRMTLNPPWDYQFVGPFGKWALQGESGGLASNLGQIQVYGGVNVVSYGHDSVAWVGARYQLNGGDLPTTTSTVVAEQESGWWLIIGLARTPGITVTASINPERETVAGTVGLSIDNSVSVREGPGYQIDESLKFYPRGGNFGVDLRWQPKWLNYYSWSPQDNLVLAYDFGSVEEANWEDNSVTFDQLVIGWAPTWQAYLFPQQLVCTAGSYLALGGRAERIHADGPAPRFPEGKVKFSVVGQGELFTRFGWKFNDHPDRWYNQLRVGFGIDGWLPFPAVEVQRGEDHDQYLIPEWSGNVTIGVTVDW